MQDFISSFIIGFACLIALFVISVAIVVISKTVYLYLKDFFSEPEKEKKKKKRKSKKPAVVRSVEIDPEEVDRIYVKKIS